MRPAAVLVLLLVLPALSGCFRGPTDGEGDRVVVVRNETDVDATVSVTVFHSSTVLLPGDRDPSVTGSLRVGPGAVGTFLFSVPNGTVAMTVDVNGYRRLFGESQVESCPVLVFRVELRAASFEACAPPPTPASPDA